ncbi:MAG: carboxypeptidase regulatory-like domain-containing protein, partial [Luteolibacter sp.]
MTISSLIFAPAISAEIAEPSGPSSTEQADVAPSPEQKQSADAASPADVPSWQPEEIAPTNPEESPDPNQTDQALPALNGPLPGIDPAIGNCIITGEVSDAVSLNPIPGAFIDVVGTGRSAETDNNGRFTIGAMPAGTFTLEATKLGYSTESAVVTTLEGQPAETRFGLREKPADDSTGEYTLEEEVVVGEYQGDSQGDLFMELQTTPSIASGIGKDDFSRSGIGDAGDAVSKISGANIVGGRYAVVRGLGDRYSNTLVNSALISSADPSKKAVQLDLFPSDLLESVSIYKTFLPELPAEFAGGTVAIETLRFPNEPIVKFEYGLKANTQLNGDFYGSGDDLGYFGSLNDDLPSSIPSLESGEWTAGVTRFPPRTQSQRDEVEKAVQQASALHLSSPLRPIKKNSKTPESFALTIGNTFQLTDDLELGVVLAGTSSNGDTAKRDVIVGRSLNSGKDGIIGNDDDSLN